MANDLEHVYRELIRETVDDFQVSTRLYTDSGVFDDEMARVFEKTWIYVGHVSEIPEINDYKTANIGRRPVIVVRSGRDEFCVLVNECKHRGNAICREEKGNVSRFVCPYHSWTYKTNGELVGATHAEGYAEGFAQRLGGLDRAAVGIYQGLIFANLSPSPDDLSDHLGPVKSYIDLWAEVSPEGQIGLARPHKYAYRGNWKFMAENGYDGWHAKYLHQSAYDTMEHFGMGQSLAGGERGRNWAGHASGLERGHGFLERPWRGQGMTEEQDQAYQSRMASRFSSSRLDKIIRHRHVFVFPNLYLFDYIIRVIHPVAVDYTTISSHFIRWIGADKEVNRLRLKNVQRLLGTGGMVGTDDVEMCASNQAGMAGTNDWVVLSQGMRVEQMNDLGERIAPDWSETPLRALYRHWRRVMST